MFLKPGSKKLKNANMVVPPGFEPSFNAQLTQQGHDGQTNQQIIDRMGQNAWQDTSGFFIDPCPEQAAPTDTQ